MLLQDNIRVPLINIYGAILYYLKIKVHIYVEINMLIIWSVDVAKSLREISKLVLWQQPGNKAWQNRRNLVNFKS